MDVFEKCGEIGISIRYDLEQIKTKDPACIGLAHALMNLKGFHGVTLYRVANYLLKNGQE